MRKSPSDLIDFAKIFFIGYVLLFKQLMLSGCHGENLFCSLLTLLFVKDVFYSYPLLCVIRVCDLLSYLVYCMQEFESFLLIY